MNDLSNTFSREGTPLQIRSEGEFLLFIDPIYFQKLIDQTNWPKAKPLFTEPFFSDTKKQIFPYAEESIFSVHFIEPKSKTSFHFDPQNIKARGEEPLPSSRIDFDSDSGQLLIIDGSKLIEFCGFFDWDALVEALHPLILTGNHQAYLEEWAERFGTYIGYIGAPGIASGFEFEGGGSYYLPIEDI